MDIVLAVVSGNNNVQDIQLFVYFYQTRPMVALADNE